MHAVASFFKRDAKVTFFTAIDVHTHIASQLLTDAFTGGGIPAPGAADLIAKLHPGGTRYHPE